MSRDFRHFSRLAATVSLMGVLGCTDAAPMTVDDACEASSWTVNDVSFLFPLPADEAEAESLLAVSATGDKGPLLPEAVYVEHIGVPYGGLWEGPGREEGYARSRIVAARIDPCSGATQETEGEPCVRELRLSAQPYFEGLVDAALHLIYRLSEDDYEQLLGGLAELRAEPGDAEAPLGPHPVMGREGLTGPFASKLKELLLAYAGSENLARVTAMKRGRNSTNWEFILMDRDTSTGTFARQPIPATGGELFQAVNEIGVNDRVTAINPLDPEVGYPEMLLESAGVDGLSEQQLQGAFGRLASFEDPARHSAETLDCASCHLANARGYYEGLTGVTTNPALVTFVSPDGQNTARVDGTDLSGKSLRAFGYFGSRVAISQRTINESATVADSLSWSCPDDTDG